MTKGVTIDVLNDELIPLVTIKSAPDRTSVQKITGKNPRTVLSWTKRGLASVKIGGSWYTNKEALEQFLERGCIQFNSGAVESSTHERSVAMLEARFAARKRKRGSRDFDRQELRL